MDLDTHTEFPSSNDLIKKVPKVNPDTHIIDMLKIAWHNDLPIGVVDEFDHFMGWVYRGKVIDFLTRNKKHQWGK
jgi:ABC-type proline/glycine betaine transport system ATPase subunit